MGGMKIIKIAVYGFLGFVQFAAAIAVSFFDWHPPPQPVAIAAFLASAWMLFSWTKYEIEN